ncbi:MAG TPA: hypothetical protein VLA52_17175 [Thermohalobaculum sp.]|nr:hypothetical protein [Thermohalobaculum sp.]
MVWTTLIALDHANRTGNYSVLRDLAAPGFRKRNDPARLAGIFAKIREQDLGLGRVVLSVPVYSEPPTVLESGHFQVIGSFPARPVGVRFELLFEQAEGAWRLFGISVGPAPAEETPGADGTPRLPKPKPEASGG